jgi:hypothetical protein
MTGSVQGLVVMFISHPGLCKTEICERLPAFLPGLAVEQFNTNTQPASVRKGEKYWQRAVQVASSGTMQHAVTVVLAHKCLVDSPRGELHTPCLHDRREKFTIQLSSLSHVRTRVSGLQTPSLSITLNSPLRVQATGKR